MTVEPMFIFCLCAPFVCNALRGQKASTNPQDLELQTAMSHHVN